MSKKLLVASALVIWVVVGAYGQDAKDEAAIKSVIDRLISAQTAYDAKALDAVFTSDYIEVSPVGEVDPRAKVLGFYTPEAKAAAGNMSIKVTATEHLIRTYGNFAVAIVRLEYASATQSTPMPPRGIRASCALRKESGQWKIAFAQYTGIRPPAPPRS